jgi:hypothetical protein
MRNERLFSNVLKRGLAPPGVHRLNRREYANAILNPQSATAAHGNVAGRLARGLPGDTLRLHQHPHAPLGKLGFRQNNLEQDHTDQELLDHLSQKVQVKGVMSEEQDMARIYVLSFETVGESCG